VFEHKIHQGKVAEVDRSGATVVAALDETSGEP
jgi:hypothetical protein